MFAVHFYASCFDSRGNSIRKKNLWLDLEKAVYQLLFVLANTLPLFDWRYIDLSMLHDQKVLMLLPPIDKCPMDF